MSDLSNAIETKIDAVKQVFRSGGLYILMIRVIAFIWKQIGWLFVRISTHDSLFTRNIYGNIMYLNLNDVGLSQELAVYKVHEPVATEIYRKLIKPGMCVAEIGANIGYYALQAASLVGKTGKVIAIEPIPENVALIKRSVEANHYENISVHEMAIGPENTTSEIFLSRRSNLHSFFTHADTVAGSLMVTVRTLDSFLENEDHVDYIRMDIEGYEIEAIKGMRNILKKHKPGIYVELHAAQVGKAAMVTYLQELKDFGYRVTHVVDKAYNYPMVSTKKAIEKPSIDELMADRRIVNGEAVLAAFFEAD